MYRYLVFIYNIFVLGSVINIKLKREYQITNLKCIVGIIGMENADIAKRHQHTAGRGTDRI